MGEERDHISRRRLLATGASVLGGFTLPRLLPAGPKETRVVQPFATYSDLLKTLKDRGHKLRILGHAPDRSPVVAVKSGGQKKPAILISAGSHATEQAGVLAAVELIDHLKTEHTVYVLPCRDPIGLNGYQYALSLSLGTKPKIRSLEDAEALLRNMGEVLLDSDGTLLVLIGEYGYANRGLYRKIKKGEAILEPLKGRRIWFPSRYTDVPGSGLFQRAYTLVVTPDGEVLHLNRFHDTRWAPVEVRCIRKLMSEIKPGLTFDLHEYGGDAFWMSARRQRTDEDEIWERRMAAEAARSVAASGAKMVSEQYSPGSFFTRLQQGVYWLDPSERGEGLNLIDFASRRYGPGFTIETGMRQPFQDRVKQQMLVVQTAADLFAERYARK
jgi:hypothetical protein